MNLRNLINPIYHPVFSGCVNSKIWDKDVEEVTDLDLYMLYARVSINNDYKLSLKAVHLVFSKIEQAYNTFEIRKILCKKIEPRIKAQTVHELVSYLNKLSLWQRKATLFALINKLRPDEVCDLTWKGVLKLELCRNSRQIVNSCTRHIHIVEVFYDLDEQKRLNNLEGEVRFATKMPWSELQTRDDNLQMNKSENIYNLINEI